jgi:trypsin
MRVSAILATALVISAYGAAPALAVDEGVPDFGGHPNVGLMGFDVDGTGPEPTVAWCTGTVVSDDVFLTAAHCLINFPPGTAFAVTLEAGTPANPVARPGRIFDDFPYPFSVPGPFANEAVIHPKFGGDELRTHDVGVLRFDPGTFAGVTPVQLPRPGQLDRVAHRRQAFRLAGYGGDPEWGNGDAPVVIAEGYRQTATAPFKRLTLAQLQLDGRTRATGQGGLCLGDSGSPQFLGDSNLQLSLMSNFANDCHGTIFGQRLDTPSERRFLADFVDLPGRRR